MRSEKGVRTRLSLEISAELSHPLSRTHLRPLIPLSLMMTDHHHPLIHDYPRTVSIRSTSTHDRTDPISTIILATLTISTHLLIIISYHRCAITILMTAIVNMTNEIPVTILVNYPVIYPVIYPVMNLVTIHVICVPLIIFIPLIFISSKTFWTVAI
eukprot:TRINITY_DN12802_c0_g1::TRINITY_DN12802_c0_g1_i1::g.28734::m.28734 TRINITY_DN12802_c0_g1::TRINITY_DN12802_c0_g1_i1::g.28734  ORF type:complete len:157 (+),score=19.43,DUF1772/PF08592.6/0.058 TRINITY_DN12802_c0_g1_i1:919-1389(+)